MALVELLIALSILLTLGTLGIAGVAEARSQARERVLQHTLDNFVTAQEQARRSAQRYQSLDGLLATRAFVPSDHVILDSVAIDPQRVYLRVRHEQGDELCSVDHSWVSRHSVNRAVCFRPGEEPARTADPAPTAGIDTFELPAAPAPPPPPEPGAALLLSPLVSKPADQTGAPGATLAQTFRVTNRSSAARSFALTVSSSNPAVVATPASLAPVTIGPGASAEVTVPYTVAPTAEAGTSSVVPLEAVDTGDGSLRGVGDFTVSAALVMAAPSVSGPADQAIDPGTGAALSWAVRNATNAPRVLVVAPAIAQPGLSLVGTTNTGVVRFGPGETKQVTASVRVDFETEGGTLYPVRLEVSDREMPEYRAGDEAVIMGRLLLASPLVSAPAPLTATPGEPFTARWLVTNPSNAARTLSITPTVDPGGDLGIVSIGGAGPVTVPRRGTASVEVNYRLPAAATAPRSSIARLSATDLEAGAYSGSATLSVATAVVRRSPAVTAPADRSIAPDSSFSAAFTVRNESNTEVVFTALAAGGDALSVTSIGGGSAQRFAPFETRAVTVSYRLGAPSVAGTTRAPTLTLEDQTDPAYRASAGYTVTTAQSLKSPSFTTVPLSRSASPGAQWNGSWVVKNESNAARTLVLTPSLSASGTWISSAQPAGAQSFAPYEAKTVTIGYAMDAQSVAGSTRDAVLAAQDQALPALGASARYGITTSLVVADPTLPSPAARGRSPGTTETVSFTLTNRTNAPRTFRFATGSSNASVAAVPAVPANVTVPAYGSQSVAVTYAMPAQVVAGGATTLSLAATDLTDTRAASASFTLTANEVLLPPQVSNPADRTRDPGAAESAFFVVVNQSNSPRTFTLSLSSSNAAAATVEALSPTTITAAPYATVGVTVSYAVPAAGIGGTQGAVILGATDAANAALNAMGRFWVTVGTVLRPPTQTTPPGVTLAKGALHTATWTITNPSNVARTYTIAPGVSSTAVAITSSSGTGSVSVPARGSVAATVNYQVSANAVGGTTHSATLATTDPGAGAVTTALAIRIADVVGCMDPAADNYNRTANIPGTCRYTYGCMDPTARNYSPTATRDDGSCTYDVWGCMEAWADNYNPAATKSDESCEKCGCMQTWADNYDFRATHSNGPCGVCVRRGCMDPIAENYDPLANDHVQALCIYRVGCMDPNACNYDPLATKPASCTYCLDSRVSIPNRVLYGDLSCYSGTTGGPATIVASAGPNERVDVAISGGATCSTSGTGSASCSTGDLDPGRYQSQTITWSAKSPTALPASGSEVVQGCDVAYRNRTTPSSPTTSPRCEPPWDVPVIYCES